MYFIQHGELCSNKRNFLGAQASEIRLVIKRSKLSQILLGGLSLSWSPIACNLPTPLQRNTKYCTLQEFQQERKNLCRCAILLELHYSLCTSKASHWPRGGGENVAEVSSYFLTNITLVHAQGSCSSVLTSEFRISPQAQELLPSCVCFSNTAQG